MIRFFFGLFLAFLPAFAFAQETNAQPQMADAMRADGKIYVVVAILGLIVLLLLIYLFSIDRKVTKLEREQKNFN